jgi:hypothetical protein
MSGAFNGGERNGPIGDVMHAASALAEAHFVAGDFLKSA